MCRWTRRATSAGALSPTQGASKEAQAACVPVHVGVEGAGALPRGEEQFDESSIVHPRLAERARTLRCQWTCGVSRTCIRKFSRSPIKTERDGEHGFYRKFNPNVYKIGPFLKINRKLSVRYFLYSFTVNL